MARAKLATGFIQFAANADALGVTDHANNICHIAATEASGASTLTFKGVSNGNVTLSGLADPSSDQQAATKKYVDAQISGTSWKASVRTASTAAGTLASDFANGDTVGGVAVSTGDRILIKDQASGSENGIYTVNASGAPTRATDFDAGTDKISGTAVLVREGTNADIAFMCTTDGTGGNEPEPGTDALTFTAFVNTAGTLADDVVTTAKIANAAVTAAKLHGDVAGAGLANSGTALSVNVDDTGIEIDTDTLRLKDNGVTTAKINNAAVTAAKLHGDVAGDGLANSGTALSVNVDDTGIEINADTLRLKDSGVATAKIADAAVTAAKLHGDVAGAGLANSGSALSVSVDNSSIEIDTDTLRIKASGVTNDMLAGGIANAKLANSTVTIGGVSVALGATLDSHLDFSDKNITTTGSITAADVTCTSDEYYKCDIHDSDGSAIFNLRGIDWRWNEHMSGIEGQKSSGVLAQEIQQVLPYAVAENDKGLSVRYNALWGPMIEAVKSLKSELDELKQTRRYNLRPRI